MSKRHLSDSRVISLLFTSDPIEAEDTRAAGREHIASCDACRARLEEYRRFASALHQAAVWDQRTIAIPPFRDWLRRITAVMDQIRDERTDADEILATNLKGASSTWRAKLALIREVHTIGMTESLIARTEATFANSPATALDLAALAVEIADELRIDLYPFDLAITARARAWRELAYALYYVGRFPDALRAVDRAEELFRQMPAREFDLARTGLIRSLIYRSIDRVAEAIDLARSSAQTFLSFGDDERFEKAQLTEAFMLIHQRLLREALAALLPLEREDSPLRHDSSYGMLLQGLGICYRDLGELAPAREYFHRAAAEHEARGATAELVRTRWSLAATIVAAGEPHVALPMLRAVWKDFTDLGVDGDAALVGLEVVEALLIIEQPDDVPAICRTLLDQFTRNGMNSRAVTALSYLREAVAMGKATPVLVRHVHDFIRDIPKHPTRSFTPPRP